jgi:hypothetical protein
MSNSKNTNLKLFNLLKVNRLKPIPLDVDGKKIPSPKDADVFQFSLPLVVKEEDKLPKTIVAHVTIDDDNILKVLYDDNETSMSPEWTNIVKMLKRFGTSRQLDFELIDDDEMPYEMEKRKEMKKIKESKEKRLKSAVNYKKQQELSEGYYPLNKKTSYNDCVPEIKLIIHHTKVMENDDVRYRNIEKIYLENANGERILSPSRSVGISKIYGRILSEGDKPYGEKWNHVSSLVEDYLKMSAFNRAVKSSAFNESAQPLIDSAVSYLNTVKESLKKLSSNRGFNSYFDNWSPVLNEDTEESSDLTEMFKHSNLDPRIEAALPILSKLSSKLVENEIDFVEPLEEWASEIETSITSIPN